MLRKDDAIKSALAYRDAMQPGRKIGTLRGLGSQVHEGLADRLPVIRKAFARFDPGSGPTPLTLPFATANRRHGSLRVSLVRSRPSALRFRRLDFTGSAIERSNSVMSTFVLIHGAWHTGAEFEAVAAPIRAAGHTVHVPTVAGNRAGDAKTSGLEEAIQSIVDYIVENDVSDIILMGHSYGGMVITGGADRVSERIRRLVYWNAFVPNDGQALVDMVPPNVRSMFDEITKERGDGSNMLPFPVWREAFINDADLATATLAYEALN